MSSTPHKLLSLGLAVLMAAWMPLWCYCGMVAGASHHAKAGEPAHAHEPPANQAAAAHASHDRHASHAPSHCHRVLPPSGDPAAPTDPEQDEAPEPHKPAGPCECPSHMQMVDGLLPAPALMRMPGDERVKHLPHPPNPVATATLAELDRHVRPPTAPCHWPRPRAELAPSLLALHCSLTL